MAMNSKFSVGGYFPVIILTILLCGIGVFIALELKGVIDPPRPKHYLLFALLTFVLFWLIWGELRTKMIKVYIDDDSITVRRFGGLGRPASHLFSAFDGFTISRQSYGARGILEFVYLMQEDRKVIKISEAYHKNYNGLKAEIAKHCTDLGYLEFSFAEEFKEIFV